MDIKRYRYNLFSINYLTEMFRVLSSNLKKGTQIVPLTRQYLQKIEPTQEKSVMKFINHYPGNNINHIDELNLKIENVIYPYEYRGTLSFHCGDTFISKKFVNNNVEGLFNDVSKYVSHLLKL